MSDANRALVQRFYDEVISGGNLDLLDELLTPDFFDHDSQLPPGPAGFKLFVGALRIAFPDFRWTVDDWVVGADKVVARGHGNGTHRGEFMGVPPSGKPAEWSAIHIFRVADSRLAERWSAVDVGGLLERLRSAGAGDAGS
jgi:predicted ester cyclase